MGKAIPTMIMRQRELGYCWTGGIAKEPGAAVGCSLLTCRRSNRYTFLPTLHGESTLLEYAWRGGSALSASPGRRRRRRRPRWQTLGTPQRGRLVAEFVGRRSREGRTEDEAATREGGGETERELEPRDRPNHFGSGAAAGRSVRLTD